MTNTLIQFQWTVAPDGYRIIKTKKPDEVVGSAEQLFLTDAVPFGGSRLLGTYSPSAGLFHSFADLKPNQAQILEFAGEWGMLTRGVGIRVGNSIAMGERLDTWIAEIKQLSIALRLWKLTRDGNTTELGQYIIWSADNSGVRFGVPNHAGGRWIATRLSNADLLQTFREGDRIRPAWHQLQHIINEKLDGKVSARLLWDSSHTRLSLHQVPSDLISALWLPVGPRHRGQSRISAVRRV